VRADLSLKYAENARLAAVFFEWRHKLMTFVFTVTAALVVAFGWLLEHDASKWVASAPLFVAASVALAAVPITARHGDILRDAYKRGAALEEAMSTVAGGYSDMYRSRTAGPAPSMTAVLMRLYGLVGLALLTLAALQLIFADSFRPG
jgi:phosphoglycerol transferase MdoB-like AlkP superfamily enzyme